MELIRGAHNLRPGHRGCVATIGNFDGVHLGHQAVLGQLAEKADDLGLPGVVIIFEPQPMEYFAPDKAAARLSRFREKIHALRRYSVDRVLVLRFDQQFAALSASEFIEQVLVQGLDVRYLVVGDDFHFGHGRSGNFDLLCEAGRQHDFEVVNMHTFYINDERVSSTRIREALLVGKLHEAEQLLGRPYRMSGRVAHGHKRGRSINYPTANIHLHRHTTPIMGVYAVEMFGIAGEPLAGVANIGSRPTVDGTRTLLEVHLFNFDRDIYGCHVDIQFVEKIRDEQRFDSFEQLREQIDKDAEQARRIFARH